MMSKPMMPSILTFGLISIGFGSRICISDSSTIIVGAFRITSVPS